MVGVGFLASQANIFSAECLLRESKDIFVSILSYAHLEIGYQRRQVTYNTCALNEDNADHSSIKIKVYNVCSKTGTYLGDLLYSRHHIISSLNFVIKDPSNRVNDMYHVRM